MSEADTTEGETFTGHVDISARRFRNCEFRGAVVSFDGSGPAVLDNCGLDNIELQFDGPAGVTVAFLRGLARAGGQDMVRGLLGLA